jgi:hypothetical protein
MHAHFDYGGGDQDFAAVRGEVIHDFLFFGGLHTAVQVGYAHFGQSAPQIVGILRYVAQTGLAGPCIRRFIFFDGGADNIRLPPRRRRLADKLVYAGSVPAVHGVGLDGNAARRQLVDDRNIQIPVKDQRQRAGDGRCGHDKGVGGCAFLF